MGSRFGKADAGLTRVGKRAAVATASGAGTVIHLMHGAQPPRPGSGRSPDPSCLNKLTTACGAVHQALERLKWNANRPPHRVSVNLATASTLYLLASSVDRAFATDRSQIALDQTHPAGPALRVRNALQRVGAPKRTKLSSGIIGKLRFGPIQVSEPRSGIHQIIADCGAAGPGLRRRG